MASSYFDPYYASLDRQKIQIVLETDIFQGNLLHETCIFLETPKRTRPPVDRNESHYKSVPNEDDDLEFAESMDLNLHAIEGTKLATPLWMARALITQFSCESYGENSQDYSQMTFDSPSSNADISSVTPRPSGAKAARILVPRWYQSNFLHRLATPVYSTKHMMHEFAASNLNKEVDEYFYDVGMCLVGLSRNPNESERIEVDLYKVYQNRYYFILRGACTGATRTAVRCIREQRLAQGMLEPG